MTIQELLVQGREILARKQQEADADEEKERRRITAIFAGARAVAVQHFAPISEDMVEPKEQGEWKEWRQANLVFSIRPFDGGRINVRLDGRQRDEDVWEWLPHDSRHIFYVENTFTPFVEADGAYGEGWHTTNSLAEALALCELEGVAYRKCVWDAKEKQQHRTYIDILAAQRKPTPAEALLEALERWHSSL